MGFWDDTKKWITDKIDGARQGLKAKVKTAFDNVITPIVTNLKSFVNIVKDSFIEAKTWVESRLKGFGAELKNGINWTTDLTFDGLDNIKNAMEAIVGWAYDGALSTWKGVVTGFKTFGSNLLSGIEKAVGGLGAELNKFADYFITGLMSAMENIEEIFEKIQERMTKMGEAMRDKVLKEMNMG